MADVILTDPQGREVELADATWYGHIIAEHAELTRRRREVERAITAPVAIHDRVNLTRHPTGIEYFGLCSRRGLLIMVATEEVSDRGGVRRIVKTAHFAKAVGTGSQLWP